MPRSYFTNLRKGRIENPGYEKLSAIAQTMGFPPALWCEEAPGHAVAHVEGRNLAVRIESLFQTVMHPGTGEPYTNANVARMSAGGLTEQEVEGIRTGRIADPTVGQVAVLAAVFGVPTSYLVDRGGGQPVLDDEVMDALADGSANAILRGTACPPKREKQIVLGIVMEFKATNSAAG